jgi:hypothetical protein
LGIKSWLLDVVANGGPKEKVKKRRINEKADKELSND